VGSRIASKNSDLAKRRSIGASPARPAFDVDPAGLLTALDACVYTWDIPSDSLAWGANVETTFSGLPGDLLTTGAGFAGLISADSATSRFHAIHHGLGVDEGSGAPFRAAYRLALPKGGCLEVEDFGRWFADANGRPCRVHGIVRILSRNRDAGLCHHAAFEGLQGARRAFNASVDARCAQAQPADAPFAILIAGIANLAAVNRSDGYDAGDELIFGVGRRLARFLRDGDSLMRYSGGKFAILMALGSGDQIEEAARRLLRLANGEPHEISAGARHAVVRVGAALAPRHGRNAHLLLQRADQAFEAAGGVAEGFAIYGPGEAFGLSQRRELAIADEIVAALNERRVVLAFQPVVATDRGRPGFEEALLRILKDDGTVLGPQVLIPVAEKSGLIELLDQRVLELAILGLAENPERRLSVNQSVATLRSRDWLERLKAALRAAPGAAERLTLEIIETQAIENVEAISKLLRRAKALGLSIAMDDFGAGHSSFRNLRRLGVDLVKIDGAFVQNLARSADDRFFVRTLASLARHLKIETVAEWVEDAEAKALLTEWGIDYLQGHAIGRAEIPEPSRQDARLAAVGD
jgi:diguanylate cyclase (GGDEF)-like protein